MRLFHPQSLGAEESVTPPFLADKEMDSRLSLLRETTQVIKEGKQRLPTPEKTAIMRLSNSFEKRRLGKQQQILTEMTQRCREQEVTDLSAKITAKCDLKVHDKGAHANPFYSTTTRAGKGRLASDFALDNSPEIGYGSKSPTIARKHNTEKAYKSFPARHIMRQQTKINPIMPNVTLPRVLPLGFKAPATGSTTNLDTFRSPRYMSHSFQNLEAIGIDSPRRFRNAALNSTDPQTARGESLAPLVLPRLSMVDMGYQDRIDSYFSSNQMAYVPRAKTILDAGSISGRSYRSLINLSGRTNRQSLMHNRSGLKSERSEHGLMNIPFQHDDDRHSLESIGRGFGQSIDNLIG
ncbi:hypothetical protein PoB_000442000 [Plakobranchus ocellatus]|uniref:Uncharacterized protein n=1 Tax=Plakobranchus ocellatus TaxID=259542 RepID=A0AAV3Y4B2_9GAST|nr:hypothetical protein PoB_000442000 [Plakobranchus ocellatus]